MVLMGLLVLYFLLDQVNLQFHALLHYLQDQLNQSHHVHLLVPVVPQDHQNL